MTNNDQKEAFSQAYVRAITSIAGYDCSKQEYDRDSVDITFRSQRGKAISIDAQLKATSTDVVKDNTIHFALPIKNYDDLRRDTLSPRIWIVLLLPTAKNCPEQWINQTQEQLALMKCAYWKELKGMEDKQNTTSVTIQIPMDDSSIFKPTILNDIAQRHEYAKTEDSL